MGRDKEHIIITSVSFKFFLLGLGLSLLPIPLIFGWVRDSILYGALGLVTIHLIFKNEGPLPSCKMTFNQVRIRSFFLGWGVACGFKLINSGFSVPFGLYICLLSTFHYSEFLVTSIISPGTLSLDSFLLNHSKEYGIAAIASIIEFHVEFYLSPWTKKDWHYITYLGLLMCVLGEILRKWSMFTASKNFTHLVRETKHEEQYLVTSGPYSVCRHPGYAGWFWWSIGTQLVLINPICFVGYYFAVLRFFKSRIYYEEICLLSFFGLDYVNYKNDVPRTGVPFVNGYTISEEMENNDIDENDDDNVNN